MPYCIQWAGMRLAYPPSNMRFEQGLIRDKPLPATSKHLGVNSRCLALVMTGTVRLTRRAQTM